jgi:hypothetical protein
MPIFDPATLRATIAAELQATDLGDDTNAFAAVVTRDTDGTVIVRGVVSQKIGDRWSVQGVVAINHEARISGGFEVKATW